MAGLCCKDGHFVFVLSLNVNCVLRC
uniref:Uncharacterized protein n=1 Tax=Rhizophora mucronata TaxID=61149 RepID=A0A2P2NP37_RHIMU